MSSTIMRGNIYLMEDPEPHETAKRRPVLVIQNNTANKYSSDIIIAIIRSNPKVGQLPVGVKLMPGQSGLEHESYADLGHVYTINRDSLHKLIGSASPTQMEKVNEAIRASMGLEEF